jgi:amidase
VADVTKTPPTDSKEKLLDSSATALAKVIRTKQVSSEEVVRTFLARIEHVNPQLNAVVQLRAEAALAEARAADKALAAGNPHGPLHGVPMTVKDSFDTAGVISTGGTKGRAAFIPRQDATAVARLRAAGAIVLGKTNTPELTLAFETQNLLYGRTNNPYDVTRTPGGSSGGAAAILATSGSPLDLGSDTGGSIRLPAHFCGIAGLKPTAGRVPRTGHVVSFDGPLQALTHVGPLARFVEDLSLVFPLLAGVDGIDPAIVPVPLNDPKKVAIKQLKVAFFTDNGIAPATPATKTTVAAAAKALSAVGVPVEEARPEPIKDTFELFTGLVQADGGAWVRRLLQKYGTTETALEGFLAQASANVKPTADYTGLLERWDLFKSQMLSFWQGYDVLLCPVNAHPAIPHGTTLQDSGLAAYSYTMTHNLTGWPAVVVRGGTSPEGLPIGVQIVARPWREDVALVVAQHLETAVGGWHRSSL